MGSKFNRLGWDVGISILTEYDADGFLGFQYDAYGGEKSGMSPGYLQHFYGRISRQLDRDDGGASGLLYAHDGSEIHAWALGDPRVVLKLPQVQKGGQALYDSNGSFIAFQPDDRTVQVYVPYSDGKAHLLTFGKDGNGAPIIELASGTGLSVTLLDETITVSNADGSSYLTIGADGTSVVGPFKAAGGADLGGPTSMPLAKFAEMAAVVTALAQALDASVTAAAAVPPPGAGTAIAAALKTALAGLQPLLATMNATGATVTTKGA